MPATLISSGAFVPLAIKWPFQTRRFNRIRVKALVTSNIIQSVCLVGMGRLKERCGLEPRTNFFSRLRNRQKLVRIRFGCGLDSRIYGIPVLFSWLLVVNTVWSETVKRFQDWGRYRNGKIYQNLEIYPFVKMYLVEPGEKNGNSVGRKSEANPFSFNIICRRVL